jgi:hypothetical protein
MTRIHLATGEQLEVDGPIDDVVKQLENAARSSAGTLARLTEAASGDALAVSATHVVLVRSSPEIPAARRPSR